MGIDITVTLKWRVTERGYFGVVSAIACRVEGNHLAGITVDIQNVVEARVNCYTIWKYNKTDTYNLNAVARLF